MSIRMTLMAGALAVLNAAPALAHPDAATEAGALTYLISSLVVAGLFVGAALLGRARGRSRAN